LYVHSKEQKELKMQNRSPMTSRWL
jgi:hypothetical protein